MESLSDIINKSFIRKGIKGEQIRKVKNIDNDYIIFDDDARIKIENFMKQFEEVIDPDDFFSKGTKSLGDRLDNIMQGKVADTEISIGESAVPDTYRPPVPTQKPVMPDVSKYHYENSEFPTEQETATSTEASVRPVQHAQPIKQESPEISLFKKMKRNYKVNLLLKITELIPDPKNIQIMNNMFDMSVVDYLTNDIFMKIVGDPHDFKQLIKEQIEATINKKPKKAKKPQAKAKTAE